MSTSNQVTNQQLKAIHAVLHKHQLLHDKANIINAFTNGRSTSSKDLTTDEARDLLMAFNNDPETSNKDDKGPMIRKLFAMAHEMGWIEKKSEVRSQKSESEPLIEQKNDNSRVYDWVLKYGYLGKHLRGYTYNELPKLLSQFEFKVYKPYLDNLSK